MIKTKNIIPATPVAPRRESNWDRLTEVYRYEGAVSLLTRAVKKFFKSIIQVDQFVFTTRNLSITNSEIKARVPLEIRLLRIEEAEDFAATFNQSVDRIRQRLVEGDQCIFGIVESQMVHCEWFLVAATIHQVPIEQSGLALVINPGDVYSLSAYTLRNWRGNGIAAEVAAVKHQFLKSLGCSRQFTYHRGDNVIGARSFGAKNGRNGGAKRTVWVISFFRSRWRWIFGATSDQSFNLVCSRHSGMRRYEPLAFISTCSSLGLWW